MIWEHLAMERYLKDAFSFVSSLYMVDNLAWVALAVHDKDFRGVLSPKSSQM